MDKSYIILLHAFASEHLNDGFTYKEVIDHLAANGIDTKNENTRNNIDKVLRNEIIFGELNTGDPSGRYFMTGEAYYRHLDYLEMRAAQGSAKDARKWAIVAIAISGFLALLQVILAVAQVFGDKTPC